MSHITGSFARSVGTLVIGLALVSSLAVPFAEAATCSIWAENTSTLGSATLRWTATSDATSAYIDGVGSVNLSGTQYVSGLTSDRTYTMRVYDNTGASRTCQTTVYASGNSGASQRPSCTIAITGYRINTTYPYESAMLSWSSWNATSASINPSVGSVGLNGSQTIYPSGYQMYTMTVLGNGGTNTCQTNPADAQPLNPYSGNLYCTIAASPASIQNGAASSLTWTSYGARSAWLSDGIGVVSPSGFLSVRPESSRVYTLTITDTSGRTNTCQTIVSVLGSSVKLTQIPYTGDFGPLGTALTWLLVVLLAGAGASGIAIRSRMFAGRSVR